MKRSLATLVAAGLILTACSDDAADPAVDDPTPSTTASTTASGTAEPTAAPTPSSSVDLWFGAGLEPLEVPGPAPRPDVVYVAFEDGRLAVVDVDGGEVVRVVATFDDPDDFGGGDDQEPVAGGLFLDDVAVTPDGRILVVDLCCEPAAGNIVLVDAETGELGDGFVGISPAIRGDGRWVASTPLSQLVGLNDLTGAEAPRSFPRGDAPVLLDVHRPAWSPDGMALAVQVGWRPEDQPRLLVLDLADPITSYDEARSFTPPDGLQWAAPAFRRDGMLLVAEQLVDDPNGPTGDVATAVVLDPRTGERLTEFPLDGHVRFARYDASHTWLLVGYEDGRIVWLGGGAGGTVVAEGGYAAAW